jgi:hypothetical protein
MKAYSLYLNHNLASNLPFPVLIEKTIKMTIKIKKKGGIPQP